MEDIKLEVAVEVTFKDGDYIFNILAPGHLTVEEIRSILVGGVCLTIHGEKTPKDQARVLTDVIKYMEQDFVDIDSFRDVEIKPQSKEWMYIQSTYIEPMFKFIKKIDIPTNTTPFQIRVQNLKKIFGIFSGNRGCYN